MKNFLGSHRNFHITKFCAFVVLFLSEREFNDVHVHVLLLSQTYLTCTYFCILCLLFKQCMILVEDAKLCTNLLWQACILAHENISMSLHTFSIICWLYWSRPSCSMALSSASHSFCFWAL